MRKSRFVCLSGILFLMVLLCAYEVVAGEYTAIGAEAAGNPTGEIPAFEGGKGLKVPAGYKKGDVLPDPYKGEKPLFRIDHTNVDQYQERLSPGQIARIKRNKNFYMNIYPGHRNIEYPPAFYAATEKNKKTCHITEEGNLAGYNGGVPFPFPKNGLEAISNVRRYWMGDDVYSEDCRRVVSPSGKIKKTMRVTKILTLDESRLGAKLRNPDNVYQKLVSAYTYPADEAGTAYLTISYHDGRDEDTWLYIPSLRRVRRAPTLSAGGQIDGESTMDELGVEFRGTIGQWDWKLVGKKEMYIPANNYSMWEMEASDEQECSAGDINPAHLRYELHRVWVIEGTIKEGVDHPYSKRVGYYDEDCWMAAAGDRYDKRGKLWRMSEYYAIYDYYEKLRGALGYIYLNLESGRYEIAGGCWNKKTKMPVYNTGLNESEFTVQALRRAGR